MCKTWNLKHIPTIYDGHRPEMPDLFFQTFKIERGNQTVHTRAFFSLSSIGYQAQLRLPNKLRYHPSQVPPKVLYADVFRDPARLLHFGTNYFTKSLTNCTFLFPGAIWDLKTFQIHNFQSLVHFGTKNFEKMTYIFVKRYLEHVPAYFIFL